MPTSGQNEGPQQGQRPAGSNGPSTGTNRKPLLVALVGVGAAALILATAAGAWFVTRDSAASTASDGVAAAGESEATTIPAASPATTRAPGLDVTDIRLRVDGPRTAAVGEAVTYAAEFDAAEDIDAELTWTFDDEARTGSVVTFAWDEPGVKQVTATMTASTGGGQATSSQQFTVEVTETENSDADADVEPGADGETVSDAVKGGEATNGILADFSWNPATPSAGQSIELIDNSNIEPASKTWRWQKSTISTGGNLTISVNQPTEVTLEVCRDQAKTDCDSVTKLIVTS